jgi:hypothetical protein
MLSSSQRKSLEFFVGKVCSILVVPINRKFDEETNLEYFLGIIQRIEELGIWYSHISNGKMNFVFMNHIVSIAEETFLPKEKEKEKDESFPS